MLVARRVFFFEFRVTNPAAESHTGKQGTVHIIEVGHMNSDLTTGPGQSELFKEEKMFTKRIIHGVLGGILGGLVFGAMMAKMGVLPMIGKMVGQPSAGVGFAVHLVNSAIIGAGFAVVFHRFSTRVSRGLRYGLLYGGAWWLLGPLTLMPLFLGMGLGVNWNVAAATKMFPSLVGHLLYGATLGIVYGWLQARDLVHRRLAAVSVTEGQ
jgi:hypothetical protein